MPDSRASDDCPNARPNAPAAGWRHRVVRGLLIGAWVAMPLMPVVALLLSRLNGLSRP